MHSLMKTWDEFDLSNSLTFVIRIVHPNLLPLHLRCAKHTTSRAQTQR